MKTLQEQDFDCCSTGKAAQILNYSIGTIHRLVERGELEVWKTLGGHRRITMSSIQRLLNTPNISNMPKIATLIASETEKLMESSAKLKFKKISVLKFESVIDFIMKIEKSHIKCMLVDSESIPENEDLLIFKCALKQKSLQNTKIIIFVNKFGQFRFEKELALPNVHLIRSSADMIWVNGLLTGVSGI